MRLASTLLIWGGYSYLAFYGDLRDSMFLDEFNPQVWWAAWFIVLLVFSVAHRVTGNRAWGNAELGLLMVGGSLRSAIYLINGFFGPLGVWLLVLGFSMQSWAASQHPRVRGQLADQCARAHYCRLAVDPDTGGLKNEPETS